MKDELKESVWNENKKAIKNRKGFQNVPKEEQKNKPLMIKVTEKQRAFLKDYCVKKEITSLNNLYCFDNKGDGLRLDEVKQKLKLLNYYKSQIKELGIIYIPMLERYFYNENFVKYSK